MYLQQNMRCRKYYHACRTDNSVMTWQNVVIISVLEVVILLLVLLRLICHSMSYNIICSSKDTVSAHDDIINSKENLEFPAVYFTVCIRITGLLLNKDELSFRLDIISDHSYFSWCINLNKFISLLNSNL